mgnify:FL=1
MNKITLIGNLTADPVLRATPSGTSVCNFTMAVNRRFPGADGQKVTDFFNIVAWRGLGESCAKYLAKGKKAAIVGELQARTYTAKDGTTRMSLDVSADEVEFLSPKEEPKEAPRATTPADPNTFEDVSSDDLPF